MKSKKGNILVITIIIVIVAVAAGIIGWMFAKKTQTPSQSTSSVKTQPNIVFPTVPGSTAPVANNLTFTIDGKNAKGFGVEIYFEDGILGVNDEEKTITFSPKNRIIPPNGQPEVGAPEDIYQLTATDYRTADVIIKEVNESPLNTKKAEQKKINGFTVIESTDGGFCDNRYAEVVGKTYNYQFWSLGCAHDEKTDFASFEKAISTMKYID